MNIYRTAVLALACASLPLTACAAEQPAAPPGAGVAALMLPPAPKAVPPEHTCAGADEILRMICFDEWDDWKSGGPLPKTVFLDPLGVPGFQDAPAASKTPQGGNYVAAGLLGDKQQCVITVADPKAETDTADVTVSYRYSDEPAAFTFHDASMLTATLFVELMRLKCP